MQEALFSPMNLILQAIGIGEAIVQNLAAKGANIVINYTSDSSTEIANTLAKSLEEEHGIQTLVIQADLANPAGPAHLIATAKNHFSHPKTGAFQIDILINNAGIAINQLLQDVTVDAYERSYRINVLGPLLLTQAAQQYLPHDRSGRIINVSSVSSTMGFPMQTVYGGTKAALEAMTRSWSRELVERATVNAINPGPVSTDMWAGIPDGFREAIKPYMQITPGSAIRPGIDAEDVQKTAESTGGRPAYPAEVAGIVGMLCTPDSVWCTGQVVSANGGLRMLV